jgi:peptidyl-prolyl cis-trans isomerase D
MLEFFRTHTRALMLVLVPLIIGSFVFVGVEGYIKLSENVGNKVAQAAGQEISQGQWDAAHRNYLDRLRRQAPGLDLTMFDTPQLKQQLLDGLVQERVVQAQAEQSHFTVTDERLLRTYLTDPRFASVRNPDGSINKPMLETELARQGLTVTGYEARLRDELTLRQVTEGISATAFAPAAPMARALDAKLQQREVQLERFEPTSFSAKLSLSEAQVAEYYQAPGIAEKFKSTEEVDAEIVVLDLASIEKAVVVPEDEVRKFYDANDKRYTPAPERRASHIMFKAAKSAPPAQRDAARSKAQAVLAELQKTPGSFAELAKKNSEDSVTSTRGGDTGIFFNRGDADPAYEEALFALQNGALSGVVEAADGFYIVRLDEIRGGEKRPFDSVKSEIQDELAQPLIKKRLTEVTQEFTNLAYEQSDSLKPLAERFKLPVRSAKAVTRSLLPIAPSPQNKDPLVASAFTKLLFDSEAIQSKRNTEAITIHNQLVSGRVLAHRPAALQDLAVVSAQVKQQLSAKRAAELAHQAALARLEQLRAAPATVLKSDALTISRVQPQGLPSEAIEAILQAPATPLPALLSVDLKDQAYAVVKLSKVLPARDTAAGAEPQAAQNQYAKAWSQAEEQSYLDALKLRYKAKIMVAPK